MAARAWTAGGSPTRQLKPLWAVDYSFSRRPSNAFFKRAAFPVAFAPRKTCEIVTKRSRHAWISSQPMQARDLHERCNLCARHRWDIENSILVEKCHGYEYEHCFARDWNAMKGYHYLMRIGHLFNVLVQLSEKLAKVVRSMTVRGFVSFVRDTVVGGWLIPEQVTARLRRCLQLRLE